MKTIKEYRVVCNTCIQNMLTDDFFDDNKRLLVKTPYSKIAFDTRTDHKWLYPMHEVTIIAIPDNYKI